MTHDQRVEVTLDLIREIPLQDIAESPFNPRKLYSESALTELAHDISRRGVLSPVLVRPRTVPLFADDPNGQIGYELVFGHRRLRAAATAGLATIPAVVRDMSEGEVKLAQISENLHRSDVHAIEEAEGYQALMQDHGVSADELVEQTGKSRSYIYGRLKLLQAIPKVRKACLDGLIGSETALLIARLRDERLQERALKAIESKYLKLEDGGKKSFRAIRDLLANLFTADVRKSVFASAANDVDLLQGATACDQCPKLSCNAPEFVDLAQDREGPHGHAYKINGNAWLCTDLSCFEAKVKAFLAKEAQALKEHGHEVITGAKARAALSTHGEVKGAYISVEEARRALKAAGVKDKLKPVLIQDPKSGHVVKAVARATVAIAAPGVLSESAHSKAGSRYVNQNHEQARAEREERARLAQSYMRKLMEVLANTESGSRAELEFLALALAERCELAHYVTGEPDALAYGIQLIGLEIEETGQWVRKASPDQLRKVILAVSVWQAANGGFMWGYDKEPAESVQRLGYSYGVAISEFASTPSSAGASAALGDARAGHDDSHSESSAPAAPDQMDDAGGAGDARDEFSEDVDHAA